jgi:hypothetical protein
MLLDGMNGHQLADIGIATAACAQHGCAQGDILSFATSILRISSSPIVYSRPCPGSWAWAYT